jgi:hypothetical protein
MVLFYRSVRVSYIDRGTPERDEARTMVNLPERLRMEKSAGTAMVVGGEREQEESHVTLLDVDRITCHASAGRRLPNVMT